ncbi:MAG: glycine zipper family protein, partial [Acetobacteraceae bacterium]|nr:glycine zipper family protein [Acetobacteraceae bacterium]
MNTLRKCVSLSGALLLADCAVPPPPGPTVMAVPGPNKNAQAFQQDDISCRQYAAAQSGFVSPSQAATQSAVGSAAVGTALGAAGGAAIGAAAGNPGAGAAIGAGSGLVLGSAVGANNAKFSADAVQQVYVSSYAQCMNAKGNSVQPVATAVVPYPYPPYPYPPYGYPYAAWGYPYPAWY